MSQISLLPGVRVLERGWLSSNNIFFEGHDSTALVDSGYATHSQQTVALVKGLLNGRDLNLLINTHLHSDHCGGNAALQGAFPELQTAIPPGLANQVRQWDSKALTFEPTGQECLPFCFNLLVKPGSTVRLGLSDWQVHAATGHDPHSIILFEISTKTLISADALWENGFGVVFPELDGVDAFKEVRLTLDLIEQLQPRVVIPGHGKVFNYSKEIAARARARLNYFVDHPHKHAQHAAKVLLKFKLLEVQRIEALAMLKWAEATSLLRNIHASGWSGLTFDTWVNQLCDELVKANAALRAGTLLINV